MTTPATATPVAKAAPPQKAKAGTNITYCPREAGDPHETSTMGYKFKANVPRLISDPVVIEGLRHNKWFELEGDPNNRKKREPIVRPKVRLEREDEEDRADREATVGLVGAKAVVEKYQEVDSDELDEVPT